MATSEDNAGHTRDRTLSSHRFRRPLRLCWHRIQTISICPSKSKNRQAHRQNTDEAGNDLEKCVIEVFEHSSEMIDNLIFPQRGPQWPYEKKPQVQVLSREQLDRALSDSRP